jgi:hypothetical protein
LYPYTQAYDFYDIVIWSATSMKWVEVKMKELGVLTNPNYKILQFLDHGAMITVHTEKYGYVRKTHYQIRLFALRLAQTTEAGAVFPPKKTKLAS